MSDIRFSNKITAGLAFKHSVNLTAYPASSWYLVAHLRGPITIDFSAVIDGNQHLFNIPAENTKNGWRGHYGYSLHAIYTDSQVDKNRHGLHSKRY